MGEIIYILRASHGNNINGMHHHFDKQSQDILYENSRVYWFSVLGFQIAVELPPPSSPSKKNKKQNKAPQKTQYSEK